MWYIRTKDAVQPSRFYFLCCGIRIIKMMNVLNLPCFIPQAPNTKPCGRLGVGTAPSNPSPGPGWRASWLHPLKQTRACRTRHSTVKPATCTSIQRRSSSRWAPNLIPLWNLWRARQFRDAAQAGERRTSFHCHCESENTAWCGSIKDMVFSKIMSKSHSTTDFTCEFHL